MFRVEIDVSFYVDVETDSEERAYDIAHEMSYDQWKVAHEETVGIHQMEEVA